mmetsp:Transcript_23601/g.40598  ORF Transcript_23601/g.40598 Transcript_23601/m.40598 type:complete len:134 (-) Transcript_23601:448-849(-)
MDSFRSPEDLTIEDMLACMDEFVPTIPEELVQYYLQRTGFNCPDPKVTRLISLAAQKFVADIANDAIQYTKIRQQATRTQSRGHQGKDKRLILSMEDLMSSLKNHGVNVRKPEYFADSLAPSAPPARETGRNR